MASRIWFGTSFRKATATTTDLDGNPISLENDTRFARVARLEDHFPHAARDGRPRLEQRIIGFVDNRQPPFYWFLMQDGLADGRAYFVGYSAANFDRVGYLGTAGMRSDPVPPAEQFPLHGGNNWNRTQVTAINGTYSMAEAPQGFYSARGTGEFQPWAVYLNSGSHVYEIDLATRAARPILSDPRNPVVSLAFGGRGGNTLSHEWLAMRTADEIHFYSPEGKLKTLPLAAELQGRELQVVERPDGGYTIAAVKMTDYTTLQQDWAIYVVDQDGTLGPPREATATVPGWQDDSPNGTYEATMVTASPAMLTTCLAIFRTWDLQRRDLADSWGDVATQQPLSLSSGYYRGRRFWQSFVTSGRRGVHVPAAERFGWPLFVFLFGIPGWIGYRYCRWWALPLDVCPACHELAPHDQAECAACGSDFPHYPSRRGPRSLP